MKVNLERGFERIVWVISTLGLIAALIGIVLLIVVSVERDKMREEIDATLTRIERSKDFRELAKEAQKQVREEIRRKITKEHEFETEYYGHGINTERIKIGMIVMAVGTGWFAFCWISFCVIRWIIRGFRRDEPED